MEKKNRILTHPQPSPPPSQKWRRRIRRSIDSESAGPPQEHPLAGSGGRNSVGPNLVSSREASRESLLPLGSAHPQQHLRKRQTGRMEKWQNGKMAKWQKVEFGNKFFCGR